MEDNVERIYKSKQGNDNFIKIHILNNLNQYIKVAVVFFIGVVIGIFFVKNISEMQKQELSEYINSFITLLNQDANIDYGNILKSSLIQNLVIGLALWVIGSTVIGLPVIYLIILFKGFLLRIYSFLNFVCIRYI